MGVVDEPLPDFRALFESSPGLYLVMTPELRIIAASDAYLQATMSKREAILGRHLFDVFPDNPDDPYATGTRNLAASLGRVLQERRPDTMAVQKYDVRRPDADGGGFEERYWSPKNAPVLGADGRVLYIIHRVEDVTEFVRLREEGTEQEKLSRELRTRAGEMEAEVYRRAQEIQETNAQLRKLHDELEARVDARTMALRLANADLSDQIEERQKTEAALRKSEEQLRQAQKLEAIGRLAGGIAHDFNNMLSVILSYATILLEELPPDATGYQELVQMKLAAERATELTRQLLAFSRQQLLDVRTLDVNDVLRGVAKMLERLLGEDVDLALTTAPEELLVWADRGQIEQVVMNLVVNARDALPNGGKVTIETSLVDLDEPYARDHAEVVPGPHVLIAVSDNGEGMDAATQERIFEPFFTTKEYGKGTGLGLSTVFGVVKQSGGHIWLYSERGSGTTFKIYLPQAKGRSVAPRKAVESVGPRSIGFETILLAEDQEQVRGVATSILRRAGYEVIEASTPDEAIAAAERHTGPIQLLVTDVVMPGMNGRELSERIRRVRPEIRVVFMSGYSDDAILRNGVLEEGVAFVQKPLTPAALTRKVRAALDAE